MPFVTLSQLESHLWKAAWLLKGRVNEADFLPICHSYIRRALPGQLFCGTQIPVCLWFLAKNKAAAPSAASATGLGWQINLRSPHKALCSARVFKLKSQQ